ncbi:MAG: hypothetical protein ACHQQS_14105 [Thermoanaerobaculales bacterium]
MQRNRIIVMALVVLCVSALALAKTPVKNWAAPLYWAPPAAPHQVNFLGVHVDPLIAVSESNPVPFIAVTPCRLVDTRHGPIGIPPTGIFGVGETRNYDLAASTDCTGLPSSGVAAWSLEFQYTTMNVPGGGSPSYLTAWPGPIANPMPANESTILGYPDAWVANSAIVQAGPDGTINVFCENGGDVIIEVNGFYQTQAVTNLATAIKTVSGANQTYTVLDADGTLLCNPNASATINFAPPAPAVGNTGRIYMFKKINNLGGTHCYVTGLTTIDGGAGMKMDTGNPPNSFIFIQSDGTSWWVINHT